MTAIGSTIYLTNGASNATFGTMNTGTGLYSTIRKSSDYNHVLLASSGSTLFGINGTTMRVSTIDPATGLLTALNPKSGTLPSGALRRRARARHLCSGHFRHWRSDHRRKMETPLPDRPNGHGLNPGKRAFRTPGRTKSQVRTILNPNRGDRDFEPFRVSR